MHHTSTVVLPIRKGSQRVIQKNIRSIGDFKYGLTEIKLKQLMQCNFFTEILVDTDLENIEEIINLIDIPKFGPKIRIERRPEYLSGRDATTDDLIKYIIPKIKTDTMVWTHVTSPFFNKESYQKFWEKYCALPEAHDSLVAADVLKEFLWTDEGPLNYDTNKLRWPFTQSLKPIYLINSAAFAISTTKAKQYNDRMGNAPLFYESASIEGFDVDWEDQFKMVELFVQNGYKLV